MLNPINRRIHAQKLLRFAETFLGQKNFNWLAILFAVLIFLVAGWLPSGIEELLKKEWCRGVFKTGFSVMVLLSIGYWLQRSIKRQKSKIEVMDNEPDKKKAVAVFLSLLSNANEVQEKISHNTFTESDLLGKQWEMPKEAIKYHLPELKKLYVFTSSGNGGTTALMPLFEKVVLCLNPTVKVLEYKYR